MRFRELFPDLAGELGFFAPGPLNALTDVPGVKVGHTTVQDAARGLHTGVTAIWPRADVRAFRPRAAGFVLHGAGEMTGLTQVQEWGVLETPVLLTSTLNVGRVHDAVVAYLAEKHPAMGLDEDVLIPVVAECDDSWLSHARERVVGPLEVRAALDGASGGPVAEGGVGAGTGMIAFDFKGGIGTSSRRVSAGPKGAEREFTVGALVNANVGMRRQLRIAGRPAGRELQGVLEREPLEAGEGRGGAEASDGLGGAKRDELRERSIIVIVATDAPMRPDQLRRLATRAGLGLGRAGSFAGHASGEIVLAFSTTLGEPVSPASACVTAETLHDSFLNPFYEAIVECVEECVLNALAAGKTLQGRDGHVVHGLPWEMLAF